MKKIYKMVVASLLLSGCEQTMQKIDQSLNTPLLAPETPPEVHDKVMPKIDTTPKSKYKSRSSLWQEGARAFFKDTRAKRVGDIVKIKVSIADKGAFEQTNSIDKQNSSSLNTNQLAGLNDQATDILPTGVSTTNPVNVTGTTKASGSKSTTTREETLNLLVSALVTQVLPNGSLVVEGSQEIRLNNEIRRIMISGILRPQDIDMYNTGDFMRMTETRISYGGDGEVSDSQNLPWGTTVLNAISPF